MDPGPNSSGFHGPNFRSRPITPPKKNQILKKIQHTQYGYHPAYPYWKTQRSEAPTQAPTSSIPHTHPLSVSYYFDSHKGFFSRQFRNLKITINKTDENFRWYFLFPQHIPMYLHMSWSSSMPKVLVLACKAIIVFPNGVGRFEQLSTLIYLPLQQLIVSVQWC